MMDIIDNVKFAVDGKVFIGDVDQFVEIGTVAELKQIVAENERLRSDITKARRALNMLSATSWMRAVTRADFAKRELKALADKEKV